MLLAEKRQLSNLNLLLLLFDTGAMDEGVSKADIDLVNRWETVEQAKGKRQGMPMRLYYAQV